MLCNLKVQLLFAIDTNPRVLCTSSVPSTVRNKCFKSWILFFQTSKSQQGAFTTAISDVIPRVVKCNPIVRTKVSESVNDVSAQVNWNVFDVKFTYCNYFLFIYCNQFYFGSITTKLMTINLVFFFSNLPSPGR